jgi:ferrous iron transport protein B
VAKVLTKSEATTTSGGKREQRIVAVVGSPNVGKSVLFNRLTGHYVTVSNYPGTTVEVSRGTCKVGGRTVTIVDTPGMYGLCPLTEEERVSRRMLMDDRPDAVIHVVDAKNLPRMLPLTAQLIEAGFPVILVLNLMDELESAGMSVDSDALGAELGIPVVRAAFLRGRGLRELRDALDECLGA